LPLHASYREDPTSTITIAALDAAASFAGLKAPRARKNVADATPGGPANTVPHDAGAGAATRPQAGARRTRSLSKKSMS
jgi:hypothetical protein